MDVEKLDWGYFLNGKIYIHFKEAPDSRMLKFYNSIELWDPELEIAEGEIAFTIINILNNYRQGGATFHNFAIPLFRWERIK